MAVVGLNAYHGSYFWEEALAKLPGRLHRTDDRFPAKHERAERSLISFLILPRNQEELLKALFIPICFVLGRLLSPALPPLSASLLWRFIGFFFVFEFLLYQARYLMNDVWDRGVDSRSRLSKRRFPRSLKDNHVALKAAFVAFWFRLMIAALIVGCLLPAKDIVWAVVASISVFIIALLYETARAKCNAVGARLCQPQRCLNPRAMATLRRRTTFWALLVTGVVGLGYALRTVVGLWLAGVHHAETLIYAAIGASLFGSTFVALTWALEAVS
jgi:hypothetical protein